MPTLMVSAFSRDKHDNEYSGESLLMAMLLRATGGKRTLDKEKELGRLLDDPNQVPARKSRRPRRNRSGQGSTKEPAQKH